MMDSMIVHANRDLWTWIAISSYLITIKKQNCR